MHHQSKTWTDDVLTGSHSAFDSHDALPAPTLLESTLATIIAFFINTGGALLFLYLLWHLVQYHSKADDKQSEVGFTHGKDQYRPDQRDAQQLEPNKIAKSSHLKNHSNRQRKDGPITRPCRSLIIQKDISYDVSTTLPGKPVCTHCAEQNTSMDMLPRFAGPLSPSLRNNMCDEELETFKQELRQKDYQLHELHCQLDMRSTAFSFEPLDEASFQSGFHKLHDFISTLAAQMCNDGTPTYGALPIPLQSLPLVQHIPRRYWSQGHAKFIVQGIIWSHLEAVFFSNPFAVFGDRAAYLAREWTSPGISPQAELWRCLTVRILLTRAGLITYDAGSRPTKIRPFVELADILTKRVDLQDSPHTHVRKDFDADTLESIHAVRDSATLSLIKVIRDIIGFADSTTNHHLIENIMTWSQYLALAMAGQPSRLHLVYPPIGSYVNPNDCNGPNASWKPNELYVEGYSKNPVRYINQPGLRKWGSPDFTNTNLSVNLIPAQVYIEDAATAATSQPLEATRAPGSTITYPSLPEIRVEEYVSEETPAVNHSITNPTLPQPEIKQTIPGPTRMRKYNVEIESEEE